MRAAAYTYTVRVRTDERRTRRCRLEQTASAMEENLFGAVSDVRGPQKRLQGSSVGWFTHLDADGTCETAMGVRPGNETSFRE
jgi:hypothetical protein